MITCAVGGHSTAPYCDREIDIRASAQTCMLVACYTGSLDNHLNPPYTNSHINITILSHKETRPSDCCEAPEVLFCHQPSDLVQAPPFLREERGIMLHAKFEK